MAHSKETFFSSGGASTSVDALGQVSILLKDLIDATNKPIVLDYPPTSPPPTPAENQVTNSTVQLPTPAPPPKTGSYSSPLHGGAFNSGNPQSPANGHFGIDIVGYTSPEVYALADGTITEVSVMLHPELSKLAHSKIEQFGNTPQGVTAACTAAQQNDIAAGNGNQIWYDCTIDSTTYNISVMHLANIGISPRTLKPWKIGDQIKSGEVLGIADATGAWVSPAGANHLHIEGQYKSGTQAFLFPNSFPWVNIRSLLAHIGYVI